MLLHNANYMIIFADCNDKKYTWVWMGCTISTVGNDRSYLAEKKKKFNFSSICPFFLGFSPSPGIPSSRKKKKIFKTILLIKMGWEFHRGNLVIWCFLTITLGPFRASESAVYFAKLCRCPQSICPNYCLTHWREASQKASKLSWSSPRSELKKQHKYLWSLNTTNADVTELC